VDHADPRVERAAAGETHRWPGAGPCLTTQPGVVVSGDQNTVPAGEGGPDLQAVRMPRLAAVRGVQSSIPAVVADAASRRLMLNATELT
jgi:hypothetical protein